MLPRFAQWPCDVRLFGCVLLAAVNVDGGDDGDDDDYDDVPFFLQPLAPHPVVRPWPMTPWPSNHALIMCHALVMFHAVIMLYQP